MNKHTVKLPREQAKWWRDFAADLGFEARLFDLEFPLPHMEKEVRVFGDQKDIVAAWELWHAEFVRICH